jgi:hypothetical protein
MTVPSEDPVQPDGADESALSPADEVRRKFQEALARKQGQHTQRQGAGPHAAGSTSSSPAKTQRTFRRKSG